MEYYSAIEKNKIIFFTSTWVDPEIVIQSKVRREKQIRWYHLYMESFKKMCIKLIYKALSSYIQEVYQNQEVTSIGVRSDPRWSFCIIDFPGNLRTRTPRKKHEIYTFMKKNHFQVWLPLTSTLSSQESLVHWDGEWLPWAWGPGTSLIESFWVFWIGGKNDGQRKPSKWMFLQCECATKSYVWGLAAHHSKANKQAKLVERKVCLFQMSETGGERVTDDCSKADSPHTGNQWGKMFYREKWRGVTTCRNSTVISDSHFQTGYQWSDQHHLGCFRYSYSSVPGAICSHLFAPSSRNCGSSHLGHNLVIM